MIAFSVVLFFASVALLSVSAFIYAKQGSRMKCKYGSVNAGSSIKVYKKC